MTDWQKTEYPPTKSFKEMEAERLTKGAKSPIPMLALIALIFCGAIAAFIWGFSGFFVR
jgi:hypothetical protein